MMIKLYFVLFLMTITFMKCKVDTYVIQYYSFTKNKESEIKSKFLYLTKDKIFILKGDSTFKLFNNPDSSITINSLIENNMKIDTISAYSYKKSKQSLCYYGGHDNKYGCFYFYNKTAILDTMVLDIENILDIKYEVRDFQSFGYMLLYSLFSEKDYCDTLCADGSFNDNLYQFRKYCIKDTANPDIAQYYVEKIYFDRNLLVPCEWQFYEGYKHFLQLNENKSVYSKIIKLKKK